MGAVYTPQILASWVAGLLREHSDRPVTRVLDPACGDGALLAAVDAEIPGLRSLVGIDMSDTATGAIQERWGDRSSTRTADTLRLSVDDLPGVDALIMNPPWGAELAISRRELGAMGYELASGQYDSWDLFIEWSIKNLRPGTTVAAIVPDSLFLPEHRSTRRLLLDRTRIDVVARLGEGWFDGVFRGVAVVVYTTTAAGDGRIRCIRLPHDSRKRVLSGEVDLGQEVARIETTSLQSTWAGDDGANFMPAGSERSSAIVRVVESMGGPWTQWVTSGRGVEIGKSGALARCVRCGLHRQPPRSGAAMSCSACGNEGGWTAVTATSAVPPNHAGQEWAPLIVGEDVRRYETAPSRWLRLGLDGVQYKNASTYAAPKLLVRKTGLGLNASLDNSGSFTTQVVFHYVAQKSAPAFFLDYLEGVLCSRVLLAVHLSRTGETEWRSHPYVTPKVLATLPIPTPEPGTEVWRQARAIAAAAAVVRSAPMKDRVAAESAVDRLVAGLFDLDAEGCAWVDTVLARTQSLQAFAHLRADRSEALRAERAA
jgi:predicted RNA methylase